MLAGGLILKNIPNLESPNIFHNETDDDLADYCICVQWICAYKRGSGKFKSNSGLYTTPLTVTRLFNQPATIKSIEDESGVCIEERL